MEYKKSVYILLAVCGLFAQTSYGRRTYCPPTCQPPDCSCSQFKYPMDTKSIPQMVYFGFDDAVNPVMASLYERLFTPERTNPNGCRIKMTLFVSNQYTQYHKVKEFYDQGMEIGVHSVTHNAIDTPEKLRREAKQQKENIIRAGVPEEEIVGWRSPFLKPAGQNQPKILKELGYTYDISYTYTKSSLSKSKPWPFTMHRGWPYKCGVRPCPRRSRVKKFWAVPVVSLMDYKKSYPCSFVDGCAVRAPNQKLAFKFLWDNFMSYYNTTRAPFGLNMHAAWFYTRYNLKAMMQFLDELQKLPDVYVVTVKQMIDWMKKPTTLRQIDNMKTWSCPNAITPKTVFDETSQQTPDVSKSRFGTAQSQPKANAALQAIVTTTKKPTTTTTTTTTPRPTTTTTTTTTPRPTTTTTTTSRPTTTTTTTTTPRPATTTTTTPRPTPTTTTTTPRPTTTTSTTTTPRPTTTKTITTTPRPTTTTTTTAMPRPTTTTTPTTTPRPTTTTTTTTTPRPTTTTIKTTMPTTTTTTTPRPTTTSTTAITPQPTKSTHRKIFIAPRTVFTRVMNTRRQTKKATLESSPRRPKNLGWKTSKPTTRRPEPSKRPWWDFWTAAVTKEEEVKDECIQGYNCKLPKCFCQGNQIPNNLKRKDTPQMVYLTVDGSVTRMTYSRYRQFFRNRRNPNGCPSRGTLFVTDQGSKKSYIRRLQRLGAEIAMRGLHEHHFDSSEHMEKEILQQKLSMSRNGIKQVNGWKTPELKLLGNDHFRLLKNHGFKYDATISMTVPRPGVHNPWPFTLDYGFEGNCVIPECPTGKFEGLWEIPTVAVKDYKKKHECSFVDGCMLSPPTKNDTVRFLWENFMVNYNSNKAPFGIHIRQVWFTHPLYRKNLDGLMKFLDLIMSLDNVYLVSQSDIIQWMKSPTPVQFITSTRPWKCN